MLPPPPHPHSMSSCGARPWLRLAPKPHSNVPNPLTFTPAGEQVSTFLSAEGKQLRPLTCKCFPTQPSSHLLRTHPMALSPRLCTCPVFLSYVIIIIVVTMANPRRYKHCAWLQQILVTEGDAEVQTAMAGQASHPGYTFRAHPTAQAPSASNLSKTCAHHVLHLLPSI